MRPESPGGAATLRGVSESERLADDFFAGEARRPAAPTWADRSFWAPRPFAVAMTSAGLSAACALLAAASLYLRPVADAGWVPGLAAVICLAGGVGVFFRRAGGWALGVTGGSAASAAAVHVMAGQWAADVDSGIVLVLLGLPAAMLCFAGPVAARHLGNSGGGVLRRVDVWMAGLVGWALMSAAVVRVMTGPRDPGGEPAKLLAVLALPVAVLCLAGLATRPVRSWCGLRLGLRPMPKAVLGLAVPFGFFGASLAAAAAGADPPRTTVAAAAGLLAVAGACGLLAGRFLGWAAAAAAAGLMVVRLVAGVSHAVKTGVAVGPDVSLALATAVLMLASLYAPWVRRWCGANHVSVPRTLAIWAVIVALLFSTA